MQSTAVAGTVGDTDAAAYVDDDLILMFVPNCYFYRHYSRDYC